MLGIKVGVTLPQGNHHVFLILARKCNLVPITYFEQLIHVIF